MKMIDEWLWLSFDELSSTNDKALELCLEPPAEKFVVTAARQTYGRGRRGRSWISLEGNLFMTQAIPLDISFIGDIVFMVSLSVLDTIKFISPNLDVQLKWPNDVLVEGCKISGILLEKAANGYIIAGTGINIKSSPSPDCHTIYKTSSLKDFNIKIDSIEFLKIYLKKFDDNFNLWQKRGFSAIKDIWLQHAKGLDEEITVNLENESKVGIFKGIDDKGALLLEQEGKIIKIYAGDIFYTEEKSKF